MAPKLAAGIPGLNSIVRMGTGELKRQADELTGACRALVAFPHYKELIARLEAEMITRLEQEELIGISDQIETLNARRIEILSELARREGTTLNALLKPSTRK